MRWIHVMLLFVMIIMGVVSCRHRISPPIALEGYLDTHYQSVQLVPISSHGEFYLPVQINGKAGRMLLDTGCNSSNLFRPAITAFGLEEQHGGSGLSGIGGAQDGLMTGPMTLTVGSLIFKNLSLTVNTSEPHGETDGILGMDLLAKTGAIIDLSRGILYLPQGDERADLSQFSERIAVPLQQENEVHIFEAMVNGVPARLLLDTGGQQSMLDVALVRAAGVKLYDLDAEVAGTGGASTRLMFACPEAVELGGFKLNNLPCVVTDLSALVKNFKIHGMLAGEILVRTGAIIDIDAGLISFSNRPADLSDTGVIPGTFSVGTDLASLLRHPLVFAGVMNDSPRSIPNADSVTLELSYQVQEIIQDRLGTTKKGDTVRVWMRFDPAVDPSELLERLALAVVAMDPSDLQLGCVYPGSPLRVEQLEAVLSESN